MNASVVGVTASAGGVGAATVSVTGIAAGDPVAPVARRPSPSRCRCPGSRPVIDGVTVSVAAPVPEAGVTVSHDASSDAVQLSVPPPVLVTASVFAAGAVPPAVALNARLDGVTESAGGTGAVDGEGHRDGRGRRRPRPGAVTVTSVVYVPAARPVTSGVTVIVPALVPLAGETLSQLALSLAVHVSVAASWLVMLSVLAAGLVAPTVPANETLVGLTPSAGGAGAPLLNTTVAIDHGMLGPVETRAAGVSQRPDGRVLDDELHVRGR